jgi:hypothetical protein
MTLPIKPKGLPSGQVGRQAKGHEFTERETVIRNMTSLSRRDYSFPMTGVGRGTEGEGKITLQAVEKDRGFPMVTDERINVGIGIAIGIGIVSCFVSPIHVDYQVSRVRGSVVVSSRCRSR